MDHDRISQEENNRVDEDLDLVKSFREMFSFLRLPRFDYMRERPESVLMLHLMFIIIFIGIITLTTPILVSAGVMDMDNSVSNLMQEQSKWLFISLAVVLAPLMEELIFRLHLRYPLLGLWLIFTGVTFGIISFFLDIYSCPFLWTMTVVAFLAAAIIYLSREIIAQPMTLFYNRRFGFIFYITVLIFAFVHIFNYTDLSNWIVAPLLVLPQLLISLFLGYVRVRNNVYMSMYFHGLYNLIPTLMFLLFS